MATESFFKDIVIKNKKQARAFVLAMEKAERKEKRKVEFNTSVRTIKDKETIRKMFGEVNGV